MTFADVPEDALLLVDTAPIIYVLDGHPTLGPRFRPLFEAQRQGRVRFAVTTTAIVETLVGPFRAGDEATARRYKTVLEAWQVVELDVGIAEGAARLRALHNLKLSDAIHAASALAINADALVTHDRDFSRVRALRVIS